MSVGIINIDESPLTREELSEVKHMLERLDPLLRRMWQHQEYSSWILDNIIQFHVLIHATEIALSEISKNIDKVLNRGISPRNQRREPP